MSWYMALRFLLTMYGSLEAFSRQFSSEESVDINKTGRRNFPEDTNPHSLRGCDLQPHFCGLYTNILMSAGTH